MFLIVIEKIELERERWYEKGKHFV